MAWNKSLSIVTALSLGMCLEVSTLAISAQAGVSTSTTPRTWQVSQFNPPDRGAPTTAVGGATRCASILCYEITPLIPKDTSELKSDPPYFGLTVTEQPSLFFHTRGSSELAGKEVTFTLVEVDSESKEVRELYSIPFNLPNQPGFLSINGISNGASSELPKLEVGKLYKWYLEMVDDSNTIVGMEGWIERVEATNSLSSKLAMADTATKRSQIYGEAGIWFDALNELAQERMTSDTPELESRWQELLQYAAIESQLKDTVVNAEFLDCCSLESASDQPDLTTHN